jgi:hypothetical protein
MFIGLVSVCSRFGFHRLGLRTGHSENETTIASIALASGEKSDRPLS